MAGLTLLYIEDDASQRAAFAREATARGFNVVTASSGQEGLRKFDSQSVDVVLCDLNMPGMNGLEVLGKMMEISPDTPFLVLTSHGSVPQAVQAIKQGAYDFILKPLDLDLIENSVRKAVDARNLKKDLAASRESLRILTENIPDIIFSLSSKGEFLSIGGAAEAIMGYDPAEMIGKSVFSLIHPDDHERVATSFEEGIRKKDESVKTIQFRMTTKQGEVKHFEVNRRLIFDGDQAVRSDGVVRDISERKMLEDELKNYSEHLEEMVKERTSRLERAYQQLAALNDVSNRYSQIQNEDQLFDEVPKLLTDTLGFDRAFVLLDAEGRLIMRSYRLEKDTPARAKLFTDLLMQKDFEVPLPLTESFQKGKTLFIEDLTKESRWPEDLQKLTGARSLIISPIKVKEKPIGIIVASIAFQDRIVTEQEVARFEMFANMVGLAVDNIRSYQFLERKVEERTQSLRESNQELIKSKTQLEALFDASPNVLMLVDSDDVVVAINSAVESIFNLPIKKVVYKPLKSFLDKVKDCFEEPDRFLKQFYKLQMKDIHKDVIELPKLASKQVKPRERLLIPVSMPVLGKGGEELGKFWSFTDMTELGKSTELLRTVVEASPIPSIVSRLDDGKVLFANQPLAELVGLKADEVIGRVTPDFYADPKDREEVVRRLKKDGVLRDFEVRIKRADGEIIWMIFNLTITELAGEKVIMGGLYDITERREAEEALRESEEKFRQLTENINQVFWMAEPDAGKLIYVSPRFEEIIGKSCEDCGAETLSFLDFIHPEDKKYVQACMSKQINKEEVLEFRIVRPDGTVRWIREKAFPIRNQDGEVYRICGVSEDFTEYKEANEALRESEERFRQLAENIDEVFWMTNSDKSQMIYVSPQYKEIWGRESDSLYEKPESWLDDIHPDDKKRIKGALSKQILGEYAEVYRIIRPDGSERWVRDTAFPIKDEDGEVYRLCGVVEDITEHKQADDALRWERNFVSAVLDTAGALIVVLDRQGRVVSFNKTCESVTGYSSEEVKDNPIWDTLLLPEEREKVQDIFKELVAGQFPNEGENYWVAKSGEKRLISWSNTALCDSTGEVEFVIAIGIDVTEAREAEEKLQLYKQIFMTASDGIAITDPEGNVIARNPAQEKYSGYSDEEIIGKHMSMVLGKQVGEEIAKSFAKAGSFRGEARAKTKGGSTYDVDMSIFPIHNEAGDITNIVGMGRDISERKRTEEALRESEERFRTITSTAMDAITMIDNQGKITYWNPAAEKIFGYKAKEALGKELHPFIVPREYYEDYKKGFAQFKKTGKGKVVDRILELKALKKGGEEITVELSLSAILIKDKWNAVGIMRNITERKRDQEAIATRLRYEEGLAGCSQALLELGDIDDAINEAIKQLLSAADTGRVYIFENFEDPTLGLCMRQHYEACAPGVKPEIDNPLLQHAPYSAGFEVWKETLARGEAYGGLIRDLSEAEQLILGDQGILSIIVLPIRVNEKWYGFIGFDDVKDERDWGEEEIRLLRTAAEMIGGYLTRRQALEALRVSGERFRSIVENASDVIYSLNKDYELTYVSPRLEQYLGFPTTEFVGKSGFDMVDEKQKRRVKKWLSGKGEEGDTQSFEFQLEDKNGDQRWIISNETIIRDEGGDILEIIGISHDITEMKRVLEDLERANQNLRETQAQLAQSDKMASLGMLVAGIAHEINTPIGAINSMHNTLMLATDKLREALKSICSAADFDDAKIQKTFKIVDDANRVIESGTERVATIVRRLRSFARLDEAELQEADIHEGLEDTLTLVHHEIKHNIKINRNYGDLPPISCYPGQLNQVFMNLLINAKQAIKGKGEITITTSKRRDKVFIEFQDTGVGIPPDQIEKIFDPGFTTKGVGVGTGLGLSICYQIIQDHHGEIQVQSEVGKGTTFTIILPTGRNRTNENK